MKVRKTLAILSLGLCFGTGVATMTPIREVKAEEEITEVSVEEVVEEKEKSFVETFLMPFVLAIGGMDIGTIAFLIIRSVLKSRKEKEASDKHDKLIAGSEEILKKFEEAQTILKEQKELIDSEQEKFRSLLEQIEGIAKECEKVPQMKGAIIALAESIVEEGKTKKENIVSGASKKFAEIEQIISSLK